MNDEQQQNISNDAKFSKLPDHVLAWLFSVEAADNIREIAKELNLDKEKTPILAKIVGQVILKEVLLEKFPIAIKQLLGTNNETTQKLSIATAIKEFLPIRDYLKDSEKLIVSWGGALPAPLPSIFQPKITPILSKTETTTAIPAPASKIVFVQKSLRRIVQENKEALNQILTATPLKIADFDQPVRGSIKNWLADYVKQKGAERHDQMVRGDYLFKSANAKNLPSREKLLVAEILKSYDENSALAYDEANQTIVLENTEKISPQAPEKPKKLIPAAPPTNPPSNYREPIEKKDLSGATPLPSKITPPIDGRVINLKDFQ